MPLRTLRNRLLAIRRRLVPDVVRPHGGAVANARAAVARDRRAAARRAAAEQPGELRAAVALLALDLTLDPALDLTLDLA